MKKVFVFFILFICGLSAQPELDIRPGSMRFEDVFNRLENVYLINKGTQELRIDSIRYNSDYYFLRFNNQYRYPFYIGAGDSVLMDCILTGFLFVPVTDTVDTMFIYSNSRTGVEDVRIKIDFFDDDYSESLVTGNISSGGAPVAGADVYFFYEGTYLLDSAKTDINGNYSNFLYPGSYLVAAEKESFHLTFYNGKPDPFTADLILLGRDSSVTANIELIPAVQTGYSVSGRLFDTLGNVPLRKGLIVVKKGTHTPGKISDKNAAGEIYSAVVKQDGSYSVKNIIFPDFYFIQSFSSYYIPAYYTNSEDPAVYWQQADSVLISSSLTEKNISMLRDSSFGGGRVLGTVRTSGRDLLYDVMIYARALNSSNLYSFGTTKEGNFKVNFLPYGNYELIGQKTGFQDAFSGPLLIDPLHPDTSGIELIFTFLSAEENEGRPDQFELKQNYPNPFNPSTNFEVFIPKESFISLKIYNSIGQEIQTLYAGSLIRGNYSFRFEAKGLSSGAYIAILKGDNISVSRKIMLLK